MVFFGLVARVAASQLRSPSVFRTSSIYLTRALATEASAQAPPSEPFVEDDLEGEGEGEEVERVEREEGVLYEDEILPPFRILGPAGKMAENLYSVAALEAKLPEVTKDVKILLASLKDSEFRNMLYGGHMNTSAKIAAVKELAKQYNTQVPTEEFLSAVLSSKLQNRLEQALRNYLRLVEASTGLTEVKITTASELSAEQQKKVEDLAVSLLEGDDVIDADDDLHFVSRVDPSIMGGLQIIVQKPSGDQYMGEYTLSTWVRSMNERTAATISSLIDSMTSLEPQAADSSSEGADTADSSSEGADTAAAASSSSSASSQQHFVTL